MSVASTPATTGPLLGVEGLVAGYGESQILTNMAFDVPTNGAVCLLGRNGVGKTTTLKAIVGLIRPRSGPGNQ